MTITITQSTDKDLSSILRWLKKEYDADEDGRGFYNNRRLIREGHREGTITILREDDKCVAFHLHGDILEVRPDKRRMGYGRALAEQWIENSTATAAYLFIECAPSTSLHFWKKMGFKRIPDRSGLHTYALRMLNKTFELPEAGEEVSVTISFYPERAAYEKEKAVSPVAIHRPRAIRDGDHIKVSERLICVQPDHHDDLVVKIEVDSEMLYFDKAKYAKALGIQRYRRGHYPAFYCDYLMMPETPVSAP